MPHAEWDGQHVLPMRKSKGGICIISTVQNNYKGYSKQQINKAEKAKEATAMVGHPTKQEFLIMVCSNIIQNCNVTPETIANVSKCLGLIWLASREKQSEGCQTG